MTFTQDDAGARRVLGAARTVVLLCILLVSCSTNMDLTTGEGVRATVNGAQFVSTTASFSTGVQLTITAVDSTAGSFKRIDIVVVRPALAPGTFNIGHDALNSAGYAEGNPASPSEWTTASSDAVGTLTLTEVSATHLVGTFSFTAVPVALTGATGVRNVNGSLDITR